MAIYFKSVVFPMIASVVIGMDLTTIKPETTTEDTSGRLLSLPISEKCAERPVHFSLNNHSYFYSGNNSEFEDSKVNWLDARNICREYCMDLVSIETPSEDKVISDYIKKGNYYKKIGKIHYHYHCCNFF